MKNEVKSWSVVLLESDYAEIKEKTRDSLSFYYRGIGEERVVASTVFYPLKEDRTEGLDYKMLQVWVTSRAARRVVIKVVIRDECPDYEFYRKMDQAFEKITDLLGMLFGEGKVNIV